MLYIRLKGIKKFKDRHGRERCYYRPTGEAIDLEKYPWGSEEFRAEYVRISSKSNPSGNRPGTLSKLIQSYRLHQAFLGLAGRTRQDYEKVFEFLRPIEQKLLGDIETPFIVKLRDRASDLHGLRFGHYVKQVLSTVFSWGVERGYLKSNPAKGIRTQKSPRGKSEANRPWTDAERACVMAVLPAHMQLAVGLMMFCALDPQDALMLPRGAIRDGQLNVQRSKTGNPLWLRLPQELLELLSAAPTHTATTICANSNGKPWTVSGFRASWRKVKIPLEEQGRIDRGLTLKGLRHTVATILSEMGYDETAIADYLAQKTTAMARHYSRRANKTRKLNAVVESFDAELNTRRTKLV